MQNSTNQENLDYLNKLLNTVDWKGINEKDINQIKYEVECWYKDYSELQRLRKVLGEDLGESFDDKFNRYINDRIQMILDREI